MNEQGKKDHFQNAEFRSPEFESDKRSKRFNERSVLRQEQSDKRTKGSKSPHFKTKSGSGSRAFASAGKTEGGARYQRREGGVASALGKERVITEITADNARKNGTVKVTLKSSTAAGGPGVKKTGPLSPRAPEKIKKNRTEEMKVYGESACAALFAERPQSIVRVWTTVEVAHKSGDLFRYLAANKKVYHVVDNRELSLVSATEHHGGICMLVKKARPFTLSGYLSVARSSDCLVLLDGVRNAHNIGGIIRTCAFFGVKAIVLEDHELLNSAAAMRVAEGGMEYVHGLQTESTPEALRQLRQAGYQIVFPTTDKRATAVDSASLAAKTVLVLSEQDRLVLAEEGDKVLNLSFANPLPGNGLNVAVQAGVLLAKWQAEKH
ncbi:TrmH RNA methyltransferase [Mesocricetibacter intestinalis]|uniref:TrmH RNA methyltransferase n=1 Tax=Mesocricetibacter intestinalis TaxID=1521930 RepID=A0A4R6VG16_9PAST|nr:TrmH family RNA methyltransferase [Mesocricetibacter intestinalis]TDQ56514.1 TrmH RNA methyltransferase [Mesocricetibacter intestinalis]